MGSLRGFLARPNSLTPQAVEVGVQQRRRPDLRARRAWRSIVFVMILSAKYLRATNHYHVKSQWDVPGSIDEVATIFQDTSSLVDWWPSTWLTVTVLEPGGLDALGRTVEVHTKGWFPYTLRFVFEITKADRRAGFSIRTRGDFDGRGRCTAFPMGRNVKIVFDWRVVVRKPAVRFLSAALWPVFIFNHRWSMERGREGLVLEIARRRSTELGLATAIPPPRGPTFRLGGSKRSGRCQVNRLARETARRYDPAQLS